MKLMLQSTKWRLSRESNEWQIVEVSVNFNGLNTLDSSLLKLVIVSAQAAIRYDLMYCEYHLFSLVLI